MSACQIWTGLKDRRGYGRIKIGGKDLRVTRVALSEKLGRPIGDGLYACHTCDNPSCYNPDHLFEGSAAENYADSRAKGRNTKGSKVAVGKLDEDQVTAIRASDEKGLVLAARYGVTPANISAIRNRKTWKHVP